MQATQIKSVGSFTKQTHTHLQNTEDLVLAGRVMIPSANNRKSIFSHICNRTCCIICSVNEVMEKMKY